MYGENIRLDRNRNWLIFFLCFNVNLFAFSPSQGVVILENQSEIDIMYIVRFNDTLRYNDTINGVKISWVSSIKKDIIQKDDNRVLFRIEDRAKADSILKFNDIIMELFVYTINGELIFTKEDIADKKYYSSSYYLSKIKIDENIVKKGKEKYQNEARVDSSDFKLTRFDGIEFYNVMFDEWFSIDYLFSNDAWGIGINASNIRFLFFNYFHIGLGLFNWSKINRNNESSEFIHFIVPNFGFNYSFNDNFRIAASSFVKLGMESHDKKALFNISPGFSGMLIYDFIGLKYTGLFTERYGYMNGISICYIIWGRTHRYVE